MTSDEAEALFLAGMPGPAAELGLGAVLAAAELKLLAALPAELGARAGRIRERFHLDAPGWFRQAESTPHLAAVADAVWRERLVDVRYRRWQAPREVTRTLAPLGVVLKAGRWYLVARPETEAGETAGEKLGAAAGLTARVRTYRVSNILDLVIRDERFDRPEGFDLAAYWQAWAQRYEESVYRAEAVIRLTTDALRRMPFIFPPAMARAAQAAAEPPDEAGRVRTVVPIESVRHGHTELLKLGAEVEVLAPPELRALFAGTARDLVTIYLRGGEEPR
jgi:predicted DNA-binding transcriptional regulator YafY